MRTRFDLEALDPDDPFELDSGNLPHLAKHAPFTAEDALDAWAFGNPLFYPAAEGEPADWLIGLPYSGRHRRGSTRSAAKGGSTQVPSDRHLPGKPRFDRAVRGGLAPMSDPDAEAFEYYEEPTHREPPPGRPRRRPDRALTEHVPVRFPAATIKAVRALAETDGMTVSAWIRRAVDRALGEQGPSRKLDQDSGDARVLLERLQRGLAELATALDRSKPR